MAPRVHRDASRVTDGLREPLRECLEGRARWPVFIYGGPGTGKTCAALVLCDYYLGQYWALPDLMYELARDTSRQWDDKRTYDIWDQWERWPLGVLDELAIRSEGTAHERGKEYDVLMRAIEKRIHQPTVFISNIGPDGVERCYDDRIASRVCSGTVIELASEDRRLSSDG